MYINLSLSCFSRLFPSLESSSYSVQKHQETLTVTKATCGCWYMETQPLETGCVFDYTTRSTQTANTESYIGSYNSSMVQPQSTYFSHMDLQKATELVK